MQITRTRDSVTVRDYAKHPERGMLPFVVKIERTKKGYRWTRQRLAKLWREEVAERQRENDIQN
jgi:hypothetical protein